MAVVPPTMHATMGNAPGYTVEASAGRKRGHKFVIGDGNNIAKDGQVGLNLQITIGESTNDISSTFQFATASWPLMSVGKICVHV